MDDGEGRRGRRIVEESCEVRWVSHVVQYREGEYFLLVCVSIETDIRSKARRVLGYQPVIGLQAGIIDAVEVSPPYLIPEYILTQSGE